MSPITYYVVVPFGRDPDGSPVPLEPSEAPDAVAARRRAERLAAVHGGAVAFSRTGDLGTGYFEDAKVIATFGKVNLEALAE